jgi:hypothetical protein
LAAGLVAIERLRDATALALAKRESRLSEGKTKLLETWFMDQQRLGLTGKPIAKVEHDKFEAVAEAVPDLKRLDRYERSAWSRQKRAIRNFMNIRLMRNLPDAGLSDLESKPQP